MATRLEKLLQKEAQLKAQIQLAKAAERTLERKRDTRRKILIGAAVLARVENGGWPQSDLMMMMDGFLSRPSERELFGLGDVEDSTEEKKAAQKGSGGRSKAKKKTAAGSGAIDSADGKAAGKKPLPVAAVDVENEFNL